MSYRATVVDDSVHTNYTRDTIDEVLDQLHHLISIGFISHTFTLSVMKYTTENSGNKISVSFGEVG